MHDLKALIAENQLSLPPERIASMQNQMARGTLSFLSSDKEPGPFMLYFCGSSLEEVAAQTSLPVEVIYATAMRYEWLKKADAMRRDSVTQGVDAIKDDIIKMMLVATKVTLQKQLADIIAGRLDAKDCNLMPKNIHGLEKLINMLGAGKEEKNANTVNNFQINLSTAGKKEDEVVEIIDLPKSKLPPGVG